MPVSWEVASGPSTSYNMAGHGSTCVAVEGPKNPNVLNFRVQDAMSIGFCMNGQVFKGGSNCHRASAHDLVVRGLSSLSLHGAHYQQVDLNSTSEDGRCGLRGALCSELQESVRCMPRSVHETSTTAVHDGRFSGESPSLIVDFEQSTEVCSEVFSNDEMSSGSPGVQSQLVRNFNGVPNVSSAESMHQTVRWNLDTIEESLLSSDNCLLIASSSSEEVSQEFDDSEVQSPLKGGDGTCEEETYRLPRSGISRFYAGKSRSFSCLRDVASVKELAKTESPYARKRKTNVNSSGLPPLQKGSAIITKKPSRGGKSTRALAAAISAEQENEPQFWYARSNSLGPSRSYSLSDLQIAASRGNFSTSP